MGGVYNYFKKAVLSGSGLGATSGTFPFRVYCVLVGSGYTPDYDAHNFRNDVTNEITGTLYVVGGFALSSPLVSQNDTSNSGELTGSNIFFANETHSTTAVATVLYGSSGLGSASDPLFCYLELASSGPVTAGTFQIQWSNPILALT